MSDVWVMESGDYEQRAVYGVFSSPAAAEASLRKTFAEPYIVEWEPMIIDAAGDCADITGHFEAVIGYSTKHRADFDLTKWTIDSTEDER